MLVACAIAPWRTAMNSPLTRKLKTSLPLPADSRGVRWWWFFRRRTMVQEIHVEGFDAYNNAVQQNKGKNVFALFCGSKDARGDSWCPDCVTANPVIEKCVKKVSKEAVLIRCGVGQREVWKDENNVFRKDPKLRLKSVPTLLKVGSSRRLEEGQCADENLVQMFFEEEE